MLLRLYSLKIINRNSYIHSLIIKKTYSMNKISIHNCVVLTKLINTNKIV